MKRILSIFLGVSALFLVPLATFAGTVTTTQDFSITLPSTGEGYTVRGDATFNNLTVTGGTFTFTLDPKDQVIVLSTNKRNLTNDRGVATICNANDSQSVQSVATTGSQVIVTFTPSGTCTVSGETASATGSGGGGGSSSGGGGGSSVSSSPSPSPSPISTLTPSSTVIPTPTSSATPSPTSGASPQPHVLIPTKPTIVPPVAVSVPLVTISRTLALGAQGNDVTILQKFLATDKSIYPEGIISGYFGPKTKAAIGRFQIKYGIARKGQPGYETLGPKTRAKLQEVSRMLSVSPAPSPLPSSLVASPPSSVRILNLQAQIKALQDMLNKLKKK